MWTCFDMKEKWNGMRYTISIVEQKNDIILLILGSCMIVTHIIIFTIKRTHIVLYCVSRVHT